MDGVTTTVKVAHVRLCHSRMMLARAYPRETQEMVFDAHERAFAFFKGACTRGIYDNMKTAVETIFIGKDRQYNRRFLQMCSHHLVEPVACTPASGWEKGQVENQVGLVRERFFTPRLRVKSYDELNAWLMDKCIAWAKAHAHPERPDKTIWEVFEEERPKLVPYRGRFDGFHALPASVSKTCLVRFDNNKYSVSASAVGRPVEIHAYADRIVIRQDGRIVAEHPRCYGRGETIYDPWHYVPVLARKPGALRNGAPFKDWVLPTALDRVRRKLAGSDDGDRQMVKILAAVLTDGLPAVEKACVQALSEGVHSADVILNILARQRDPGPPMTIMTPDALRLRHAPVGDKRIIRLIQKWLKAGILEDGVVTVDDRGTGQGSVISPLLANVYLHYCFDLWAERWRRREAQGDMIVVRYATIWPSASSMSSPFHALIRRSRAGGKKPWPRPTRTRPGATGLPALADFYAAGATDYVCLAFKFGEADAPSHGTGVLYSFT